MTAVVCLDMHEGYQRTGDDVSSAQASGNGTSDLVDIITGRNDNLLLVSALIGLPVGVIAFFFLAAVTKLEDLIWQTLPEQFGWE